MSPERTQAYRRVMHTLSEIGPSKLLDEEQDRIRQAADSLIFASTLSEDGAARLALLDTDELCRTLVHSGRWEPTTAQRLVADVRGCGPDEPERELRAA